MDSPGDRGSGGRFNGGGAFLVSVKRQPLFLKRQTVQLLLL